MGRSTGSKYVYEHIDLDDYGRVVYVGMGAGCRAWSSSRRGAEHARFLAEASAKHRAGGWVRIVESLLTDKDARRLEAALIKQQRPKFNRMGLGSANAGRGTANHNAVLSDTKVRAMRSLFGKVSIREIGRQFDVCHSTARKVCNGTAWAHVK